MTTPHSPSGDERGLSWQQALQAGPECLALERLAEPLTAAEQAHVAGCARCQTERAMFEAYEAEGPLEGEGLAVAWIADRARRAVRDGEATSRPAPSVVVARKGVWRPPRWALLAASVAVVAGGATLLWYPAPGVQSTGTGEVYRAAHVEITSPTGDVSTPPTELRVAPVPGAVEYEVRLVEVDGTELWRVSTPVPTVPVPQEVSAFALPAKTLVWQVAARDAQRRVLAESGDVRFRVQPR